MSHELTSETRLEELDEYLGLVGLGYTDLQDKTALEIGAGNASIACAAKQRGLNITFGDPLLSYYESSGQLTREEGVEYAAVDAMSLPYNDDAFDITYSIRAVPSSLDTREEVVATVREILRVTKYEFRAYPLGLFAVYNRPGLIPYEDEDMDNTEPIPPDIASQQETIAASVQFLREHFPGVMVETATDSELPYPDNSYYVFRKPTATEETAPT